MSIETTINIKYDLLAKIADVATSQSISINRIITILIDKMLKRCPIQAKLFNTVKYQETKDDIIWHTLHVSFNEDVYEKALDLRKVMKMSVSFIVARAIEIYLNEVIKDLSKKGDTDNYSRDYVFISSKYNRLLNFTIFWGNPQDKLLKKYLKIHSNGCFFRACK